MSFDLKITNGDLVISNGQLKTVVDSEKLIQDILKICLTDIGTDLIHPWYGSQLTNSIVGSSLDDDVLDEVAKTQLRTALNNLKDLQQVQTRTYQRMSADEQIAAIYEISIVRSTVDMTLYNIVIKVGTKGLKPITTSFQISTI